MTRETPGADSDRPSVAYERFGVTVLHGDCLDVLAEMPDDSVDAIVTDPPYGLEFMGKDWDSPWKRGDDINADASFTADGMGKGFTALPSFTGSTNPKCLNCGGTKRGRRDGTAGRKVCTCDAPRFPNVRAAEMRAFQAWCEEWLTEALRVLKPGGHLLAFGGSRTWHRLAAAIEDAGFEMRDSIAWLYGSGFPKSMDVSKAIDKHGASSGGAAELKRAIGVAVKASGKSRAQIDAECGFTMRFDVSYDRDPVGWGVSLPTAEQFDAIVAVVGEIPDWPRARLRGVWRGRSGAVESQNAAMSGGNYARTEKGAPATPAAQQWSGWGTALKPAFEPIVVARKPLSGTVAANVLEHGTGALNIDGCRVGGDAGRWPTNVVLDGERVPHVRLRDSVPAGIAQAIREYFGAGHDHLRAVRDDDASTAVASGTAEVLRPHLPGGMDVDPDRREGAALRQRAHPGVAGADERDEAADGPSWGRNVELEGWEASRSGLRDGELGDARTRGARGAGVDGLLRSHPGAPTGDGADRGTAPAADGAGAPRQRHQDGQPAGEPGAARRRGAQQGTCPDRGGDSAASGGELRAAAEPLVVLRCYVPDAWAQYFELTGQHHPSAADELDEQSGITKSGGRAWTAGDRDTSAWRALEGRNDIPTRGAYERAGDSGGASRFFPVFRYQAKAPSKERPVVTHADGTKTAHPTVKPLALMRWLVRLVTPAGGTVLDPFLGSGTTAQAARDEGFRCIGIESYEPYIDLIRARLDARLQQSTPEAKGAPEVLDLLDLLTEDGAA